MAMSRPLTNAGDSDDIFECSVCLSSMKNRQPRALHCLHTFCEPCLVDCAKNSQTGIITCPTCRKETPLPLGGVTELPHNFQLFKFSALLRQENVCQNCLETTNSSPIATFYCNDCQKKYCDSCKGKHGTIPVFSDHQLFPILEKTPTQDPNRCALHGMPLDLYCLKCQECLCSSCAMKQNHSGHYHNLVNMRKEMDICTQEAINNMIPTWSDSLNNTMTRLNKLTTNIEDERQARIRHINAEAERLKDELKEKHVKPVQECITCLKALKKNAEATKNLIQRKQFTPNSLTDLRRHTVGCKDNKRSLENKMKNLQEVPEFVMTSGLSNFGSLETKATSIRISSKHTIKCDSANRVDAAGTNMQTQKDKRSSVQERYTFMTPGARVELGPDWKSGWKPPGKGTVVGPWIWKKRCVIVKFDGVRGQTTCRVGAEGCYDIQLV